MEIKLMKISLLLLLVLALDVQGAVSRKAGDDLARYRSEVMELGARLSTLEKEIGSKNNLYLSSIEQIKRFESDISLYRGRLNEIRGQVKEAREENKKIVQSYLLESENEATEPWQRRVHLELLKTAQNKLKAKEEELNSFEKKVAEFDVKLAELRKNEEELSSVIGELKTRKKVAMEKYLGKVEAKKQVEAKVHKAQLSSRLNKVRKDLSSAPVVAAKPERTFGRPVDDFISYKASAKGVTFHYQSIQPVKAVGDGKVVFAGDLASYGQVVLIDHGNDLRTVLLGKMTVKVKKNDTVKHGAILAYTLKDSSEAQNLYFEVRKKNTAQNTILWLEPGVVSKI